MAPPQNFQRVIHSNKQSTSAYIGHNGIARRSRPPLCLATATRLPAAAVLETAGSVALFSVPATRAGGRISGNNNSIGEKY